MACLNGSDKSLITYTLIEVLFDVLLAADFLYSKRPLDCLHLGQGMRGLCDMHGQTLLCSLLCCIVLRSETSNCAGISLISLLLWTVRFF